MKKMVKNVTKFPKKIVKIFAFFRKFVDDFPKFFFNIFNFYDAVFRAHVIKNG